MFALALARRGSSDGAGELRPEKSRSANESSDERDKVRAGKERRSRGDWSEALKLAMMMMANGQMGKLGGERTVTSEAGRMNGWIGCLNHQHLALLH